MNGPTADAFTAWVGAYLDGEMDEQRRAEMEAHLAQCPHCQEELRSLSALSGLLQLELAESGPLADALNSPALPQGQTLPAAPANAWDAPAQPFTDEVLRRLPPARRFDWTQVLLMAWRAVPLALFGLWAFLQAVTLVSGLALVSGFPLDSAGLLSVDGLFRLPGMLAGVSADRTLSLAALVAFNLRMTINLALLFGGWLAAWIAYRRMPVNTQAVTNDGVNGGTASGRLDH